MDKIFTFNILKYNPTASVEMLGRRGGKVILFTDKMEDGSTQSSQTCLTFPQ